MAISDDGSYLRSSSSEPRHAVDIVNNYPEGTIIWGSVYCDFKRYHIDCALYKMKGSIYVFSKESTLNGSNPDGGIPDNIFPYSYYVYSAFDNKSVSGIISDHGFMITKIQPSTNKSERHVKVFGDMLAGGSHKQGSIMTRSGVLLRGILYKSVYEPHGLFMLHNNPASSGGKPREGTILDYQYSWSLGDHYTDVDPYTFKEETHYSPHDFKVQDLSSASKSMPRMWDEPSVTRIEKIETKPSVKEKETGPIMFGKPSSKKKMCDVIPMQKPSIIKINK